MRNLGDELIRSMEEAVNYMKEKNKEEKSFFEYLEFKKKLRAKLIEFGILALMLYIAGFLVGVL